MIPECGDVASTKKINQNQVKLGGASKVCQEVFERD